MVPAVNERRLIFLIGAVQFVNILDFMIVMPLGPDLGHALGIPSSDLGLIGGSYTAAAAVAGIAGATFLDRFDRRKALAVALAGLVLGTLAGALATDLGTLLAARIVAGAFGGPATAIALAIVSDVVPAERRGRAMGAVMGAFAAASVLGVPAGLELARVGGWQAPFLAVGGLGIAIGAAAIALLPPMTRHLASRGGPETPVLELLRRPTVLLAYAAAAIAVFGNFALIPNLSAYLQFNLGYPREHLGLLYLVGGAVSFGTMRLAGRLTDQLGAATVAAGGAAIFTVVGIAFFIEPIAAIPVLALFVGMMVSGNFRFVPMQALASKVPAPHERARFMSGQSAVQHLGSAAGAMLGSVVLVERADHHLEGMASLGWLAIGLSALVPLLLALIEAQVRRRDADQEVVAVAQSAEAGSRSLPPST